MPYKDDSFSFGVPVFPNEEQNCFGVVFNCARLNVRETPEKNGNIITVLKASDELVIDLNKSTEEWYAVCNAVGIEGFCLKKYVDLYLTAADVEA